MGTLAETHRESRGVLMAPVVRHRGFPMCRRWCRRGLERIKAGDLPRLLKLSRSQRVRYQSVYCSRHIRPPSAILIV